MSLPVITKCACVAIRHSGLATHWGPFYWHGVTSILTWIANHVPSNLWDDITYPVPNFIEVGSDIHPKLYWSLEWVNNSTPHLCNYITMLGSKAMHVSISGPGETIQPHTRKLPSGFLYSVTEVIPKLYRSNTEDIYCHTCLRPLISIRRCTGMMSCH